MKRGFPNLHLRNRFRLSWIKKSCVDDIFKATSIVSIISKHVELKQKGGYSVGLCPFHSDSNPSFQVSEDYGNYRCWSCGVHGNAIDFLKDHLGIGFREALEIMARDSGIEIILEMTKDRRTSSSSSSSLTALSAFAKRTREGTVSQSRVEEFSRLAGVSRTTAERLEVGYFANSHSDETVRNVRSIINIEALTNSILFPIKAKDNAVTGFYCYQPESKKWKKCLGQGVSAPIVYGLPARNVKTEIPGRILVRSPIEVMQLLDLGIDNAVAIDKSRIRSSRIGTLFDRHQRLLVLGNSISGGNDLFEESISKLLPAISDGMTMEFYRYDSNSPQWIKEVVSEDPCLSRTIPLPAIASTTETKQLILGAIASMEEGILKALLADRYQTITNT